MSQFRAHPLPLFLVVIWRKEDFPGLAFRVWKTNTTPSPPSPSQFPWQEAGARIPGPATHPPCFCMSSELFRAEGRAAATVCPRPQVGPQTACDRTPLPPQYLFLLRCLQVSDPLLRVGLAFCLKFFPGPQDFRDGPVVKTPLSNAWGEGSISH